MAKCIPTLGYPSQTAAVLALRERGWKTDDIARRLGVAYSRVTSLELAATKAAVRRRDLGIRLPQELTRKLAPHALDRGLSATGLASKIITTVLEEGLLTAVLDDGGSDA